MARIEPFKGIRPIKNLAPKVASPPYDVLTSAEAKEMARGNPYSFLHIIKPEIDLADGINLYSSKVYDKASENFNRFLQDGILFQDKNKYFYIYKQIWGNHIQIGLVAGVSVEDYQKDIIKKHELTREEKEKDRMRHIDALNANAGPVFLTYKQNDRIDQLIGSAINQDPEYDFTSDDGVRHIFYVIIDATMIKELKNSFAPIDNIYVADGHHRSAAATNIKIQREKNSAAHTGDEEYNFFLGVIFPHNQTKILAYNRVVKDLNGLNLTEFFNKVSESFTLQEPSKKVPDNSHEFCLYVDGQWYFLKCKEGSFDRGNPVNSLDVSILQNNLLEPVLGVKDPRTDKRIEFIGGIRGTQALEQKVDSGEFKIAFSLFPTTIEQLFAVADNGQIMPPKSTWFEPKLKSGLITHSLEEL